MSKTIISELKTHYIRNKKIQLSLNTLIQGKSILWEGCTGASYALLTSLISSVLKRPLLLVVSNVGLVERAVEDLNLFTDFPIYPYPFLPFANLDESDEIFISSDNDLGKRLRTLKVLAHYKERSYSDNKDNNVLDHIATNFVGKEDCDNEKTPIIVSSLIALLQSVPTSKQIIDDTICINVGKEYSRDELLRWLSEGGFHSTSSVELPGEYSTRGHIVDIFATDWELPIRIEFFGDEIESIREFGVTDQRSIRELKQLEISRFHSCGKVEGLFIDSLPKDTIVLFWDTEKIVQETTKLVAEQYDNQKKEGDKVNSVSDILNDLYRMPTIHVLGVSNGMEPVSERIESDFYSVERLQGNITQVETILEQIEKNEKVVIVCSSEAEIRRLDETFQHTAVSREGRLFFVIGNLSSGFEIRCEGIIFIGSDQLFHRSISRRSKTSQKKNLSKVIDSFLELTPGELVIHTERGIARYLGIETITKANQREDHLKLEFDNSTYLYVPVSKICKIQRYVGVGTNLPKLAKINGTAWNNQKKVAQEAIWKLAGEMVELQAARESLEGTAFPPDGPLQGEFEALFPYRETDDQLTAIQTIKTDMEKTRPMDRLLCGDVGFGKTEVAMRAAFKAVEAGYQVAIMAPTTVLTEQHFRTFCERASTFPITIASLSRYSTKKEQAITIEKLKLGKIDIVIGTHRIAQKDVQFKNLGLVIIDEEQKFGVKDKDFLKRLRNLVDVLTMTATPIPRTLHFSLLGIRDISNLETPPADRLPVETKVLRFNAEVIRKAILRELNRGGQVYYVHNQIFDIEETAAQLQRIVPEARIRVGHARMSVTELESTMRDFILGLFDVLVCTTIVESGLDIPNANTIFIDKANRFGLAELHQLRGRVGREKRQAYCYLTLDSNQILSSEATKRLNALEEYDKLGSGFQIAMKDLEIRGAGNILGTEQSGHIATIGYEMYCDFLDSAVRALTNKPQKMRVEVEIDLPGCAILPDDYIPDAKAKIDFYRRLDRVTKTEEVVSLKNELLDRFGRLPLESEYLFLLAKIRLAAFEYRIKNIQLAQFENSTNKKILSMAFRAPDLMYKLKRNLKCRHIDMQFVDNDNGMLRGYVILPRDLFGSKGEPFTDKLLNYVMNLFIDSTVDKREKDSAKEVIDVQNQRCNVTSLPKRGSMKTIIQKLKDSKRI